MIKRICLAAAFLIIFSGLQLRSEEGMWLPVFMGKPTIDSMQAKGLKLSSGDIFNINRTSLKDAVVLFGSGCTGEIISDNGLLLTNYHCALKYIQSFSTVSNDYLTDGYWAYSQDEELPAPGLKATLLVAVEDVTDKVLEDIDDDIPYINRLAIVNARIDSLIEEKNIRYPYKVSIKPFFYDNEYYMFTYKVFGDVRLVGAPPSSTGAFGAETDNWVWPRHTADFAVFRIYADTNNIPAEYSPDNIPYKPKYHFRISLKGYKEGDFTMVYGYPAKTQQFITSSGINTLLLNTLPLKVNIREEREKIIRSYATDNDELRIKYAAKYARISNARKKWAGIIEGFENYNVIKSKTEQELQFNEWVNNDSLRQEKYGGLLPELGKLYKELLPYYTAEQVRYETVQSVELVKFASFFKDIVFFSEEGPEEAYKQKIEYLKELSERFFKDYSAEIDKEMLAAMLEYYYNNVSINFHPDILNVITKKSKGDFAEYADYVFSKSLLTNKAKVSKLLENYTMASSAKIEDDPAFQLYSEFDDLYYDAIFPVIIDKNIKLDSIYGKYVVALRKMQPGRQFYPDANHTLRLSYGNIKGYSPHDAVDYHYSSTLTGVMEKSTMDIFDYVVPEKLKELYSMKNYGAYAENDTMHVCFIATNHTSGGNSGSPVLNADGNLIGINFDRSWEGTMSDYFYDIDICRNISLDIRYMLFIIDKYADAGYLLDEMEFVR